MAPRTPLIAGNWKMFGRRADLAQMDATLEAVGDTPVEIVFCPPATLVAAAAERLRGRRAVVGGQDCHVQTEGAHTGDVSAAMLADAGAAYAIVGHSERRRDHGETDEQIAAKARAAVAAGLAPIVCLGESLSEREAGNAARVVAEQLAASVPAECGPGLVIAYEPIWAIGTGLTPTIAEIAEVHALMRDRLVSRFGKAGEGVRLLYGGSVKPANAAEIFATPEVDGALVGGASLKAVDFAAIIQAHPGAGN